MDVSYIHKPTSLLPPFPLLTVSTGEGRVIENLILLGVGRRDVGEKKGGEVLGMHSSHSQNSLAI